MITECPQYRLCSSSNAAVLLIDGIRHEDYEIPPFLEYWQIAVKTISHMKRWRVFLAAPMSSVGPEIGGGPEDVAERSELKSHGGKPDNSPLSLSSNISCFVFPKADITRFKAARWLFQLTTGTKSTTWREGQKAPRGIRDMLLS